MTVYKIKATLKEDSNYFITKQGDHIFLGAEDGKIEFVVDDLTVWLDKYNPELFSKIKIKVVKYES